MKQIKLKIKGTNISVETSGFKGSACQEATASLESKFGKHKQTDVKPEMYESEGTTDTVTA